jgi:carboxyl-terminal processing protease
VEQPKKPPVDPAADPAAAEPAASAATQDRTEADLRGAITNDSMTEDERKTAMEEQKKAEESAKLRVDDYQLAYAIDILKGLAAVKPVE